MVSYWDVLPPEMKEPILFRKAVAEQLGHMKTVMKELKSLCICPMTDYAAILKNNPSKPAAFYPVFLCSRCNLSHHPSEIQTYFLKDVKIV